MGKDIKEHAVPVKLSKNDIATVFSSEKSQMGIEDDIERYFPKVEKAY